MPREKQQLQQPLCEEGAWEQTYTEYDSWFSINPTPLPWEANLPN